MTVQRGGSPSEVVESRDPLSLTKRIIQNSWQYVGFPAIVLIVLGILFRHSLSWGDVATWILATTTLMAFLAAAFAGIVAYDLLKVENARDEATGQERLLAAADRNRAEDERIAWRETERRAQANKVTAWFDQFIQHKTDNASHNSSDTWGAYVQNASDLPIFDVRVFFYWVDDPRDGSEWTTQLRYARR